MSSQKKTEEVSEMEADDEPDDWYASNNNRENWTNSRRCLSGTRESLVRVAQVYERPIPIMFNSPSDRG